ncbi:unnamed protein product, partial [Nesidiocoris tenuis]
MPATNCFSNSSAPNSRQLSIGTQCDSIRAGNFTCCGEGRRVCLLTPAKFDSKR